MCTKRNGLPPISVQTQWMKEEIWHVLCVRLVWEGLVPIGSFCCCPIPEEVLALAHLKETEAQECYVVTRGNNWSATEAGLEPSSSGCPVQGIFKRCSWFINTCPQTPASANFLALSPQPPCLLELMSLWLSKINAESKILIRSCQCQQTGKTAWPFSLSQS